MISEVFSIFFFRCPLEKLFVCISNQLCSILSHSDRVDSVMRTLSVIFGVPLKSKQRREFVNGLNCARTCIMYSPESKQHSSQLGNWVARNLPKTGQWAIYKQRKSLAVVISTLPIGSDQTLQIACN